MNPALRKGEVGIWQKRFWEHHIRDAGDFEAHLRYCLLTPVKLGLVKRPEDWPYSSIHRISGKAGGPRRAGLVPPLRWMAGGSLLSIPG